MANQYEKGYGAPQIDKDEHVLVNGVNAKRVLNAGYDGANLQDLHVDSSGNLHTLIDSATIEQATGDAHNDLNLAVAGKDTAGKVQPIATDASGHPLVTEASASAIKTALEIMDDWDASDHCNIRHLNATDDIVTAILTPQTAGGLTIFRSIDLDESEEDVKQSAGQVYGYDFFNRATSIRYIKFYNATAANVTVGTTTPVITIPVQAGSSKNVWYGQGIPFSTAICVAATTAVADSDTGAPAANDVIVNIFYA
jgi:hypothetical protein